MVFTSTPLRIAYQREAGEGKGRIGLAYSRIGGNREYDADNDH